MATLSGALTLADWGKRVDGGDGYKIPGIIELLSQTNEALLDMMFIEGNLPTGHKTTVRTGLPSATWRLLNYGVQPTKSTTAQIVDTCGNLEAFGKVDKDLADLAGNTAQFRLSESVAFLEAMNQTMATALIYGNQNLNPEQFTGLTPRFNSTSGASSSANVLDAGGTGTDNTSIWLVVWGEQTVTGIFPKGKITGLKHQDLGVWVVDDSNTPPGKYLAYQDHYKWEIGLTVRDWRYVVRIANIDVSDLTTTSAANLINLLIRAVHRPPTMPASVAPTQTTDAPTISGPMGRAVIYANETVRTYLDLQALNKTNVLLQMQQWDGQPVLTFRGIPIRRMDAILNNETRVI